MPALESWVLDGLALTTGTFALMELTADPPRMRPEWVSAADSESAALIRAPLHENRVITMKLRVAAQASMDAALDQVGALVDKLRGASNSNSGIALVWTPAGSSRARTFDVLAGEITGLPIAMSGDGYSWLLQRPIVTVELTCKPYWRGTETLTSTASSSTPFVALEVASVTGDVPALGRLIVTDTATQSRRHVEWGLEGPLTYNAATSLLVDSDDMVTSGFSGAQTSLAGSYDPNASGNNAIVLVVPSNTHVAVCGTGNLSHVGRFRVKARVWCGSTNLGVRLSWRVGDGPMSSNEWTYAPSNATYCELDLGTVEIDAVLSGTQRWTGQIEAFGPNEVPPGFYVDYLVLVPTSNGYGKARARFAYAPGGLTGNDAFTSTTAGNALNARVAPLGGTWATSGDATDFVFADQPLGAETVTRSVTGGTAGRFALLGSGTPSDVEVRVRLYNTGVPTLNDVHDSGVIARYVDASNYLYVTFRRITTGTFTLERTLQVRQVVAGVDTLLATSVDLPGPSSSRWWTVQIVVYASGFYAASMFNEAGQGMASLTGMTTTLAGGGALATGKSGIFDRVTGTGSFARYYDDFATSTPASEPIALYSGRNMQIRHDDTIRQDSTGTYTGKPPSYRGSRFLVPVGTSRVLVKARRADIEAAVDANVTDATQIQVGWTDRGLAVPR